MTARLRACAVLAALVLWLPRAQAAGPAAPLRFCADPDNPPFSSENGPSRGLYIELARRIAAALGRPFQPVWVPTYFGKHAVRTTLLAGRCDGFIGLPDDPGFMGSRVIFSNPILHPGYALVIPKGTKAAGLAALTGRRVAVQFASPPQSLLATRTDVTLVTVLSPAEGMHELSQGKVDAAFLWAPVAGWINHSELHDAYRIVPVAGPHMEWEAAIGFRRGEDALRHAVDGALDHLGDVTAALMVKYGIPATAPVGLANVAPAAAKSGTASPSRPAPGAVAPDPRMIAAGHELFNENCAHCHGPDAVQGVRRRNLRLLHHRYGDHMDEVFITTVTHGRPTKGMPNWGPYLNHTQLTEILAFLHSVQAP